MIVAFKFHYPARGRKRLISQYLSFQLINCSNSITPQGDGNNQVHHRVAILHMVQIPLPRKGTETHYHSKNQPFHFYRFKFHYPARGRKPLIIHRAHSIVFVQIPLPRKGTETYGSTDVPTIRLGSNSITPQGDGNVGDRTRPHQGLDSRSNSITPQGDGNIE